MKKSMILNVLKAMSNVGFEVVELKSMIKDLGEYEPLLNTIEEEVKRIKEEDRQNFIVTTLVGFSDMVDAVSRSVENAEDALEIIQNEWSLVVDKFSTELGVNIDIE